VGVGVGGWGRGGEWGGGGPGCTYGMNDCMTAMTLHVAIIQFSLIQLKCFIAPIKSTTDKR
jgi:hypothetical protein